jgi:HEAT repeat protein
MKTRTIVPVLLSLSIALPALVRAAPSAREIDRLATSRSADDRLRAARLLSALPGAAATRRLVELTADPDPEVRGRAETALRPRSDPADRALIASRGLRHPRPAARRAALRLLAAARVEDLPRHLELALDDRDPETKEAAVGITVNALGGRGLPSLAAAVFRGREGRPRAVALLAVAGLDRERGGDLARRAARDRSPEMRVAATEILSATPGPDGLAAAVRSLRDDNWSVRLTAIRSLVRRGEKGAIGPLIGALRREEGRLREEVHGALADLTGVGLPADADRWAAWWETVGATFAIPEDVPRPAPESDASVVTFHSIPVTSRSVAFVLDRSRSMRQRVSRDREERKGDVVARELEKTLSRMKSPARFFLVAFRTEPTVFAPRPMPVTARRRAVEWYAGLEPGGRTNLYDALRIALAEPAVDTVFLLTDGAPSAGEHRERGAILAAVASLNRFRKAVIHTVDIGGKTTGKKWRGFLADLARSTGGRHVRR